MSPIGPIGTPEVLDSRDVDARIEELEALLELDDEGNEKWVDEDGNRVVAGLDCWDSQELLSLREFRAENDHNPEWKYGIGFIRDDYFEEYAQELADDIGAIDRNARWPVCHIDWAAAAEILQMDYYSVEFEGATYWAR